MTVQPDSDAERVEAQARLLAERLGEIEARLDALSLEAGPDEVAAALAQPIQALGEAARRTP